MCARGPVGASSRYGWQTLTATAQYMTVLDGPHEFLFSVGADRQFSGTGAGRVQRRGFSGVGATTRTIYLGKGLGDLDIGDLRPLAISGTFGYLIADTSPRPDVGMPGFAIEYSIPYLGSKVRALELPDRIHRLTPITELFLTTPAGVGIDTDVQFVPGAGSYRASRPTIRRHQTASIRCCPPTDARVRRWTAVPAPPASRPAGSGWNSVPSGPGSTAK
jgi:hypothetical protein